MLNSVCLQGRLTADPEMRTTKNGKNVINFCIANEIKKGESNFVNCTAWGETAKLICNNFSKGSPIIVNGSLVGSEYNGTKTLKVTVFSISFELGNKSNSQKTKKHDDSSVSNNETDEYEEITEDEDTGDLPF